MSMIMPCLAAVGFPAAMVAVPSPAVATARCKRIVLRGRALALVAAGLFFLVPAVARAMDLPKPSPFAETLPAHAGQCIPFDHMKRQLGGVIAETGGRGMMLTAGLQQRFADEWRHQLGLEQVAISITLVWLREAAIIAEFDDKACLLTITRVSLEEFVRLVHASAGETAGPMRAPTVPPNGQTSF